VISRHLLSLVQISIKLFSNIPYHPTHPMKKRLSYFVEQFRIRQKAKKFRQFETHDNFRVIYPWDHIKACFDDKYDSNEYNNHKSCPICGMTSDKLIWIRFVSPKYTWTNLCGRSGPLSICPKCHIQVEFIMEAMN
jgi:hypothetical protein